LEVVRLEALTLVFRLVSIERKGFIQPVVPSHQLWTLQNAQAVPFPDKKIKTFYEGTSPEIPRQPPHPISVESKK